MAHIRFELIRYGTCPIDTNRHVPWPPGDLLGKFLTGSKLFRVVMKYSTETSYQP